MDLLNDVINARCSDPFKCLGLRPNTEEGYTLTVWRPDAINIDVLDIVSDKLIGSMSEHSLSGIFTMTWPEKQPHKPYKLRVQYEHSTFTIVDAYQFSEATFTDPEYHSATLYKKEGAILRSVDINDELTIDGTRFAVYAPAARSVSIIGDFNGWDGRLNPMSSNGDGVWRLFIPDVQPGAQYKIEIRAANGDILPHRTDPFAKRIEQFPSFASVVCADDRYHWHDRTWTSRDIADVYEQPMSIYEVHLGSWRKHLDGRSLTYLELKDQLVPYVAEMGYTHVELLPVMEYPFDGSWGYQPIGLFAPTSRFGTADEFRALVDAFHQAGIGVIMDWVPAHFPTDSHGLADFDGSKQYEYADPKKGWHTEWKSLIYDFGKEHVVDYLVSNANYWLSEFHIDGLRVDAVASMLYLDYSREDGEWVPNVDGGNHNYEAIDFIRRLNETIYLNHPNCFTIAEESTAFPGVSKPTYMDGLGFGFKWNMGWMNDSLDYISKDPLYRQYHQGSLSFSMVYAFDEQFILPISHDEVVHGKGSLIAKMPGDAWQKFANLRAFTSYMYFHPGKKLNFMGNEIAQGQEWSHERSIDWHLLDVEFHAGQQKLTQALNKLYQQEPALHLDHSYKGFEWISYDDNINSTLAFVRRAKSSSDHIIVLINFTPTPHEHYRIGTPDSGRYELLFNSDAACYAGSDYKVSELFVADGEPSHGRAQSIGVQLPPLGVLALKWVAP